jgi:hypothetical protein
MSNSLKKVSRKKIISNRKKTEKEFKAIRKVQKERMEKNK